MDTSTLPADRLHETEAIRFPEERSGADGVLFHGSSPEDLAPLIAAWPGNRPGDFAGRSANPGL